MTNVLITRGCNQETAEQFIEGPDTFVRVCDPEESNLVIDSESPAFAIVRVDGEEVFKTPILANRRQEFSLRELLCKHRKHSRINILSMLHIGSHEHRNEGEHLAKAFTVEVREGGAPGKLAGTFKFQLLSDAEFDQRFTGFLSSRVNEEPEATYTRDARPVKSLSCKQKCGNCGCDISDSISGCENADCTIHHSSGSGSDSDEK